MSRSCQSATFSRPTTARPADDAREPADPLRDDRVALVRHRRGALLAASERLLDLAHLGPREMPQLEREPLQRGREQRERVQHLGVPVALEDLGRARRRLEPEPLAGDPLDLGIGGRVRADGARELADAHPLERARDPGPVALERERPAGELEPERRRLGVDAVRPPDRDRLAMLLRSGDDRREGALDPVEHERPGLADLERQRGVEHVRRGEAVVEPAPFLAELLRHRVDERGDVVVRARLDLRHPLGARRHRPRPDRVDRLVRHDAGLGPPVERRQLDVEPAPQLRLVRPDRRHGRAGVARNHSSESSASPADRPAISPARRRRPGRCRGGTACPRTGSARTPRTRARGRRRPSARSR